MYVLYRNATGEEKKGLLPRSGAVVEVPRLAILGRMMEGMLCGYNILVAHYAALTRQRQVHGGVRSSVGGLVVQSPGGLLFSCLGLGGGSHSCGTSLVHQTPQSTVLESPLQSKSACLTHRVITNNTSRKSNRDTIVFPNPAPVSSAV